MGLYDMVKDTVKIAQKADNIELYRSLIDIQKECLDLVEENRVLKERIRVLELDKETNDKLIVKGHCYYKEKGNGTLDGPFCTVCWDKNRKLIRMHISDSSGVDIAICHVCKFGSSYVE